MIDIHAHLQFSDYDADRDEVIARAREAGVEKMILVGTDLVTSRQAVELAGEYDFLFASVGVHPHEFSGDPGDSWIGELRALAVHPKVVAIGECGLDYFSRDPAVPVPDGWKAFQREGFLAQLGIAREKGLPMIIHTRPSKGSMDAYEDVLSILSDPETADRRSKFVLHCYQGDTEVTERFLGLSGVYFSFAGNVTYPVKKALMGTKDDILEMVRLVPTDRMFVETDCPYLAPQSVRGTRNEPAYVRYTIGSVAAGKPVSLEALDVTIRKTFDQVFLRA